MLEIIQYITSGFWVFLGSIMLISLVIVGIIAVLKGVAYIVQAVLLDTKGIQQKEEDE